MKKIIAILTMMCICVLCAGTVMAADTSYLAFTGDQHGETETYAEWIDAVKAAYDLELLSYSGDICDKNWEEDVYNEWAAILEDKMPGSYNVTTGNQEFKSGAPGNDWDSLGEGYTRIGEVVRTDDYIVYDLGAGCEDLQISAEDVEILAEYFNDVPDDIPIFVLAHYPLHLAVEDEDHEIPGPSDHRQQEGNDGILEILNEHANVIFLWGHNHTFQDPRYGTILTAGDSFTYDYDNMTDLMTINFTYANYGSFCRTDTYGILAGVTRDDDGVSVDLFFVDTDVPDAGCDSAVWHVDADGNVTCSVTAGTDIDWEAIESMSGVK